MSLKYPFALLLLLLSIVGCTKDQPNPEPEIKPDPVLSVTFHPLHIEASTHQAWVQTAPPTLTVDGVPSLDFSYGLEYRLQHETTWLSVTPDNVQGSVVSYQLLNLQPQTPYHCRLWADLGNQDIRYSEETAFSTQAEEIQEDDYSLFVQFGTTIPHGLYAEVELLQLDYQINDSSVPIESAHFQFRTQGSENWQTIPLSNWEDLLPYYLNIPQDNTQDLQENTSYEYRVEARAGHDAAPVLTSSIHTFQTVDATVSISQSEPQGLLNETSLSFSVSEVTILLDERRSLNDFSAQLEYRVQGTSTWESMTASRSGNGYEAILPISQLTPGTTYELRGQVTAHASSHTTSTLQISIPQQEDPEPDPPVGGDTHLVAGTWHLVQWQGKTPNFEVYLQIDQVGNVILWQKIESLHWQRFDAVASIQDNIIAGEYLDGTAWGTSYYFSISEDRMTWTNTNDSTDSSIYERSLLPEDLVNEAVSVIALASSPKFL